MCHSVTSWNWVRSRARPSMTLFGQGIREPCLILAYPGTYSRVCMHLHTRTRTFFGENIFSILRAQAHSASTLEYIYIYIYTLVMIC